MDLKNRWLIVGVTALAGTLRHYQKGITELAILRTSIYYLRIVRGIRGICITAFQVLFCALFSLLGLVLIHFAIYWMLTLGPSPKAWTFLVLGSLELFPALAFTFWFLSSKRWLREAGKTNPVLGKCVEKFEKRI